ncbi:hypothetical protein [Synechococcus sp. C9]|uniref:hypothetical protein n=1 Tax=Synechococcus sp. C9 TaxID=102119 RepID=UPI001FF1F2F1|nr:hypothetical protein [Synechococcus sp. C9]
MEGIRDPVLLGAGGAGALGAGGATGMVGMGGRGGTGGTGGIPPLGGGGMGVVLTGLASRMGRSLTRPV